MEFLVRSELHVPASVSPEQLQETIAQERERGLELRASGAIVRIWRAPGRRDSVAIYEARDATHLHELLASLPVWPWLSCTVEPLAHHYLEDER
ncbi:muconolactone Delta-isomerase [Conexibacter sp. CPCC 206217]|uniref:muconolactone Delta-isomerase n=1 Tax=Conexibacter sp. CPCC 206217 TaxID=3064574 RepID=UPI00271C86BE|nr:muconolactone Delta-isomerase family protein [Conexibacter sp. CPCC 206217]MDO8212579.1 muconolactone Delta-isomerase family protein [Conexibacter sp. CPCC 206217]